jgi:hypothetical protein
MPTTWVHVSFERSSSSTIYVNPDAVKFLSFITEVIFSILGQDTKSPTPRFFVGFLSPSTQRWDC